MRLFPKLKGFIFSFSAFFSRGLVCGGKGGVTKLAAGMLSTGSSPACFLSCFSPNPNEADELEKIEVEKPPFTEARRQLMLPVLSVQHQRQMCTSRIVLCEGVKKKRRTRHSYPSVPFSSTNPAFNPGGIFWGDARQVGHFQFTWSTSPSSL